MNRQQVPSKNRQRLIFRLLLAGFCCLVLCVVYLVTVLVRGNAFYNQIKTSQPSVNQSTVGSPVEAIGMPYEIDPLLGYILTPNASGAFRIPLGHPMPFHHDANGFRSDETQPFAQGKKRPRLVFLGDSFIYGLFVDVKDTIPSKTAQLLNGEAINAGVPGYSLAQILLQARRTIPIYKPNYIVVEYTPWLAPRALTGFASNSNNMLAAPYFYETDHGMAIAPPVFTPMANFTQRLEHYKATQTSPADRLSWLWHMALPLFVARDTGIIRMEVGQWLGLIPAPATSEAKTIQHTYQKLDQLAKQANAKLIIVSLWVAAPVEVQVPLQLFPKDAIIINGWLALVEHLHPKTQHEYMRNYYQWRGNPPQPVDSHPNAKADAIVAQAIAKIIQSRDTQLPSNRQAGKDK